MNYEHIFNLYRRISHPTFIYRNLLHNILYVCVLLWSCLAPCMPQVYTDLVTKSMASGVQSSQA
ncbi:unnamed protein product [Brassica rapa]|uniref:Uncharacterized protein n=1 Tax=Brassica campestris TaxID=3711 RepID=A0A8D9GNR2_BRACM|nr:unnamed protein product [Brassica rapa]